MQQSNIHMHFKTSTKKKNQMKPETYMNQHWNSAPTKHQDIVLSIKRARSPAVLQREVLGCLLPGKALSSLLILYFLKSVFSEFMLRRGIFVKLS